MPRTLGGVEIRTVQVKLPIEVHKRLRYLAASLDATVPDAANRLLTTIIDAEYRKRGITTNEARTAMSNLAVVEFPYHTGTVSLIPDGNGKPHAVIKKICENVGVAFSGQLRNLKTTHAHWATVNMMFTVAEDGKLREVATIPLDRVPMWMATIRASKVAPECREWIKQLQCIEADALADFFMPKAKTNAPALPMMDPREFANSIIQLCDKQDAMDGEITSLGQRLAALEATQAQTKSMIEAEPARPSPKTTPPNKTMTLRNFLSLHRINLSYGEKGDIGIGLKQWCIRNGVSYSKPPGQAAQWPLRALLAWQRHYRASL